jgi:hypothetical protein
MSYPSPQPDLRRQKRFPVGMVLLFLLVLAALVAGLWGALRLYQRSAAEGTPGSELGTTAQEILPTSPLAKVPASSPAKDHPEQRVYAFEYRCQPYTASLQLYGSLYDYYASQDKNFYYRGSLPSDWEAQYYLHFLDSEEDLDAIQNLIYSVSRGIGQQGDEAVLALVSLVQSLSYDCEKLFSFQNLEGTDYQTSFPYETLYLGQGVCGDTSILLAKILRELGYGVAFLVYDRTNHMAVGIRCPTAEATVFSDDLGYCYIETTAPNRIGVKPSLVSGVPFTENPQVIPIAEGRSFDLMVSLNSGMEGDALVYGDYILELAGCQEISLYKEIHDREAGLDAFELQINQLVEDINSLREEYETEAERAQEMGCKGSLPPAQYETCLPQIDLVNQTAEDYNLLVSQYNQLNEQYQEYYQGYQLIFNHFEALIQENYQDCSSISPENISIQTPIVEGE